ncbi:hypothetical protein [Nocardioides montaniterrae]
MIPALAVPSWLAVLAVLALVGLGAYVVWLTSVLEEVRAERDEADARLADAAGSAELLRQQLTQIEEQLRVESEVTRLGNRAPVVVDREFKITDMGREKPLLPAVPGLPAPVFIDTVLRESLVRTASLAAGLRHALAPEVRNRIRFEMKREVKRSRKQRKADDRMARRELQSRQRVTP